MSNTTRIGASLLLVSLVAVRFGAGVLGIFGVLLGIAALAYGLVGDWRHRRSASLAPAINWAEEFTAQVRRDRAAAAADRQGVSP